MKRLLTFLIFQKNTGKTFCFSGCLSHNFPQPAHYQIHPYFAEHFASACCIRPSLQITDRSKIRYGKHNSVRIKGAGDSGSSLSSPYAGQMCDTHPPFVFFRTTACISPVPRQTPFQESAPWRARHRKP